MKKSVKPSTSMSKRVTYLLCIRIRNDVKTSTNYEKLSKIASGLRKFVFELSKNAPKLHIMVSEFDNNNSIYRNCQR